MKVKALHGYYDAEQGKVKAGDTWTVTKERLRALKDAGRAVEVSEDEDDVNSWAKGLKKADLQKIATDEIGEAPDDSVTIPQLIEAINANRLA